MAIKHRKFLITCFTLSVLISLPACEQIPRMDNSSQGVTTAIGGAGVGAAAVETKTAEASATCRTVKQTITLANGREKQEEIKYCQGASGWEVVQNNPASQTTRPSSNLSYKSDNVTSVAAKRGSQRVVGPAHKKTTSAVHAAEKSEEFFQFTPYYEKDLVYSDPEFDVYSWNFPIEKGGFCRELVNVPGDMRRVSSIVVLKKSPEYRVTKDWLWNTFRPKIIKNVINKYCPNAYLFFANFFIEGIGVRMDPAIAKEYGGTEYPHVFKIDSVTLPSLKFLRMNLSGLFFEDRNTAGEIIEVKSNQYLSHEGFLSNAFMIPENIPGGIDGEWANQSGIIMSNYSYETFSMGVYWANEVIASYSFTEYIKDKKKNLMAVIRERSKREESDEFWALFIRGLSDEARPHYCEASKNDLDRPLACAGYPRN